MENATEKQVQALKRFAKNQELSKGILRGIQFDNLNKKEASDLITRCIDQNSTFKNAYELNGSKIKYAQNFRDNNGKFRTAILSEEELEKTREAHRQHCRQILSECTQEYGGEPGMLMVFEKRCDKIFTWIQQALDEKVRQQRHQT